MCICIFKIIYGNSVPGSGGCGWFEFLSRVTGGNLTTLAGTPIVLESQANATAVTAMPKRPGSLAFGAWRAESLNFVCSRAHSCDLRRKQCPDRPDSQEGKATPAETKTAIYRLACAEDDGREPSLSVLLMNFVIYN